MGSEQSLHMEPSPLPVLKDLSSEGLAPDAPPRPAAEGMEELDRVYSVLSGSVFSKPTRNWGPSVLLPVWGENTGGNRFHTKAIESSECVRGRPARSSTNICQWGATSQRPGGRYTSRRVSSQPERARHNLCLISQGDGIHYPVGHPLLGDGIPFLPASVTDKELVWGPEALRPVNVVSQCSDGTKQSQGWVCLLRGQRLQAHHLVSKWSSGNLGHIAGPGPQDYLGIRRSKL